MKKTKEITAENTRIVTEEQAFWEELKEGVDKEIEFLEKKLKYQRFVQGHIKEQLEMLADD